jgi:hypothetical protein
MALLNGPMAALNGRTALLNGPMALLSERPLNLFDERSWRLGQPSILDETPTDSR